MPDRFYVSESSGYPVTVGRSSGDAKLVTTVSVCDREHLHCTVRSFASNTRRHEQGGRLLGAEEARRQARAFCRELNADPELQYEPVEDTWWQETAALADSPDFDPLAA